MAFDYTKLFTLSGLVLVVGVIFTILAIKTRGKIMGIGKTWAVIGLLVISGVGLYGTGVASDIGFGAKTLAVGDNVPYTPPVQSNPSTNGLVNQQQAISQPGAGEKQKVVGGKICREQADGTNSLDTAVRNKENSSLSYLSGSLSAETADGVTLDTGTSTAGATLSYVTLNVPACNEGNLYLLGTAGVGVASSKTTFSSFDTTSKYEMLTSNSNVIGVQARDSTLTGASNGNVNGSSTPGGAQYVSGAGTTTGTAYYTNTSLPAQGSVNGYIDFTVNGTASSYGAYNQPDGVIISYDSGTASLFSTDSFILSDQTGVGLTKVTCPQTITANRNAESCWSARTLKSSDGEIRLKFKLTADLGDPVVGNTFPLVCIDDKVYFRDTNGRIAYDFFNSAGTQQGTASTCLQFVFS